MKIITDYEKIGKCLKLNGEQYCFDAGCNKHSDLLFKDEESFTKTWNEPCYLASSFFDDHQKYITSEYETHLSLLKQCNYNEYMCECMFKQLKCETPTEWISNLDSADYAMLYSFVSVGSKVFWHVQPFDNIPAGYYEVKSIEDDKGWSPDMPVFLKVQDCNGEKLVVEALLRELSRTNTKTLIERWEK